jgi:transcriptional regulator with XRE-family HTH domain
MGLAVRAARDAAKLTQPDLAAMTGIPVSTLSRTETGDRPLAFAEALALAEAFKINIDQLRELAEAYEVSMSAGSASSKHRTADFAELQRLAIEAAIAARATASLEPEFTK